MPGGRSDRFVLSGGSSAPTSRTTPTWQREQAHWRARRAGAREGLLPRAQPADHWRRHARLEVGLHQRLPRGRERRMPIYDWTIIDRIFDTYLTHGVKPVRGDRIHAEGAVDEARALSALVDADREVQRDLPRLDASADRLQEVGRPRQRMGAHAVERYGVHEVERWYWEVWNEPNIGYWSGTPEEFRKLHDYRDRRRAARAAHRARRRTGRRRRRRRTSRAIFSSTRSAARTTRPARRARRSISCRSTRRASPRSSTATCGWASPSSSARSTPASA